MKNLPNFIQNDGLLHQYTGVFNIFNEIYMRKVVHMLSFAVLRCLMHQFIAPNLPIRVDQAFMPTQRGRLPPLLGEGGGGYSSLIIAYSLQFMLKLCKL